MKKTLGLIVIVGVISGCVPAPKPTIGLGTGIGIPQQSNSAYGLKPQHYQSAIKNYFSTKLKRGSQGQYKFGEPKRAYKQK